MSKTEKRLDFLANLTTAKFTIMRLMSNQVLNMIAETLMIQKIVHKMNFHIIVITTIKCSKLIGSVYNALVT